MLLGIDMGGSATKMVWYEGEILCGTKRVEGRKDLETIRLAASDWLTESGLTWDMVQQIVLTGVGAGEIDGPLFGIPTWKVEEFTAISVGGQTLSGMTHAIVVSAGTGTAFIRAEGERYTHLGGSGLGGGTLTGLSSALLKTADGVSVAQLALSGDLGQVDLRLKDITRESSERLPEYATASNFGKLAQDAEQADIAAGIVNLVLQNIGVMAYLARGVESDLPIVVVGAVATLPQARTIFDQVGELYHARFIVPSQAEFATAIGAAEYVRRHGKGLAFLPKPC